MAGPIRISILANGAQAKRELTGVAGVADRISGRMAKLRLPATAALGAIGLGAKKAVESASNLSEEISKSEEIFGKQSKAIQAFAGTADTALGQSKQQALDATSTFGLIAQKAGLAGGESAKFAQKFTGLASDLASFNNTTPEEAITAIGSAMRGESEPIRKYGVMLDDATLRARALKLGLTKTTKEALTPQQKALAASAEIMAQTSKAQGDFARTSDGAANKARIVAAQTENLAAGLGKSLLPAYQAALQAASSVVAKMTEHGTATKAVIIAVAALAAGVLAVSAATSVVSAVTATWTAVTMVAAGAQKIAAAASLGTRIGLAALAVQTAITSTVTKAAAVAQWALNAAMTANPIGLIVLAIVALVAAIVIAYKKSDTFRAIVQKAWAGIKTATMAVFNVVRTIITTTWRVIGTVISTAVRLVLAIVRTQFTAVRTVVTTVWNAVRTATSAVWNVIRTVVSTVVRAVVAVVRAQFNAVRSVVSTVWNAVKSGTSAAWNGIKSAVSNAISAVVQTVTGLRSKVTGIFSGAGSWLLNAGKDIIQGLINGIDSMIGTVKSKLSSLTKLIPKVKGPPAKDRRLLRGAGRSIIRGLVRGFEDGFSGVKKSLGEVTDRIEKSLNKRYDGKALRRHTQRVMKSLRNEYNALKKNGTAQDRITKKLADAQKALADLRKTAAEYAQSVADSVISSGSITSLGEGAGFGSAGQMIAMLQERVKRAEQYAKMIKDLVAAGLNNTTLQQLISAGVEGGYGTAQTLLTGGSTVIDQVNALTSQLTATAGDLGQTASDAMYGAGVKAAEGLVKGLESQAARLDAVAQRLADRLAKAVNQALKNGGKKGGKGGKKNRKAGSRLADGFASADLSTYASSAAGGGQVSIKLTAEQTSQLQRGREIQIDLDAYRRAGGRVTA